MAKAKLMYPFKAVHGRLKMGDTVYMRTAWGQCIIQRVPRVMSEKRRKACEEFGRRFGTDRKKIDDRSYTDRTQCSVNGPLEDSGR